MHSFLRSAAAGSCAARLQGYGWRVSSETVSISVEGAASVSGLWQVPSGACACLVLAHGAGAGMAHKWMQAVADGLAERRIATLRYQFPYMERRLQRVD